MSRIKAGLKVTDIEPVQLVDTNAAAAAFNTGRVDVFSGGLGPVKESVDRGEAKVLILSDDLEIPSLTVFTARGDVIRDEERARRWPSFSTASGCIGPGSRTISTRSSASISRSSSRRRKRPDITRPTRRRNSTSWTTKLSAP